jgi:hypothetical protein
MKLVKFVELNRGVSVLDELIDEIKKEEGFDGIDEVCTLPGSAIGVIYYSVK